MPHTMSMTYGNRYIFLLFLICAILTFSALDSWAATRETPSHSDGNKNPEECSGCHRGKGVAGTPLLKGSKEDLCFQCHGSQSRGRARTDIQRPFNKRSKHPIYETTKYHVKGEDLPESNPSSPRHVSCFDCHSSHVSTSTAPWAGARGYGRGRVKVQRASFEYELCYLCHSDSANLPPGAKNKSDEFDPFNESYHSVEAIGRNKFVPSLVKGLTVNSRITCSDCHGSNDPGGPRGPHGSDYEPILLAEYRKEDGVESAKAYELCYMCHDRRSILGDTSFNKHSLHVVSFNSSCFNCHNSHGVRNNKHLIGFNPLKVSVSNSGAGIQYLPQPIGKCYLRCHNIDHQASGVWRPNGTKTAGSW